MRTSFITDREEMESVINQCQICFIGLTEKDGTPYVIPMNFGYIDGDIILHSAPEGKHLGLLELSNRICVTFCTDTKLAYQHPAVACSYSMTSKSVVCKGSVTFIEDLAEKERTLSSMMKKFTDREFRYSKPALQNVRVWRVTVDQMTSKAFGQNFKN
ncbi:MAG: pyridoxamine 5'-phosphate oxidase family protein [Paludibacter sp.]|nr:pyridoxamine 5'-phosphate oxidase family protein [Paludibacter sp.]